MPRVCLISCSSPKKAETATVVVSPLPAVQPDVKYIIERPIVEKWVPRESVGLIIGKRGASIRKLQEMKGISSVVIHTSRESPAKPTTNLVLVVIKGQPTVVATVERIIDSAVAAATKIPEQVMQASVKPIITVRPNAAAAAASSIVKLATPVMVHSVSVPPSAMGRVIGKRGVRMRGMRLVGGARALCMQPPPPHRGVIDATFKVRGTPSAVAKISSRVAQLVKQTPPKPEISLKRANKHLRAMLHRYARETLFEDSKYGVSKNRKKQY